MTTASWRTLSHFNPADFVIGKQVFYFQPIMDPFFWKETLSLDWDRFSCWSSFFTSNRKASLWLHEWGFHGVSTHCWKGSSPLLLPPPFPPWAYFWVTFWEKRDNYLWVTAQYSFCSLKPTVCSLSVPLMERQLCLNRRKRLAWQAQSLALVWPMERELPVPQSTKAS